MDTCPMTSISLASSLASGPEAAGTSASLPPEPCKKGTQQAAPSSQEMSGIRNDLGNPFAAASPFWASSASLEERKRVANANV